MLQFAQVDFSYDDPREKGKIRILKRFNFSLRRGEISSVVGLSGRGKTTIGKLALGLDLPDAGSITWDGARVEGCQDQMGAVFQDYTKSLFGWLSVERNVYLGIANEPLDSERVSSRVRESLALSGLESEAHDAVFLKKTLGKLSGGQQQRVALARAIAREPSLLILDEPFASLDSVHRRALQERLVKLSQNQGFGTLLVTHDIDEAILVSDKVVVLVEREDGPGAEMIRVDRHARLDGNGIVRSQQHDIYAQEVLELLRQDENL